MRTEIVKATNPAYERLLQDYTEFHMALVVVGGLFMLALLGFGGFTWARSRQAPRGFERRTYLVSTLASTGVGLLLALVVAANLSNVLNPQPGLAGAIGTPGDLKPAASAELTRSLTAWVRSSSTEVPPLIQGEVDARLAWQEPKAVICALLLVVFVALSTSLWRSNIARSRAGGRVGLGRITASSLSALACLPLILMVMGNVQASHAPIVMTLLFG